MKIRLGQEFKKYLEKNFITVNTLADELGLSNQGLHKIVSGKTKRPYNSTLKKIASHLDLRLSSDEKGVYFLTTDENIVVQADEEISRSTEILSSKLAALMSDKSVSVKATAESVGKREQVIIEYVNPNNPNIPDIPTLKKFAELLDVSVDFLVSDEQIELKERILSNLQVISEGDKNQTIPQFKRKLPQDPEYAKRKFRRLLDIIEAISPESLELLDSITSMNSLLFKDKWLTSHINEIITDYQTVKESWFELFWLKAQDSITECKNTLHLLSEKRMVVFPDDPYKLGSEAVDNYAEESVRAIFAADPTYWREPYSEAYWKVNAEAIQRKVKITRIFAYKQEVLNDSIDILKRQKQIGVDVYVVFANAVPPYLVKHMLMIDAKILSISKLTNDGRIISERITIEPITVEQTIKQFEQLLRYSKRLDDFLREINLDEK